MTISNETLIVGMLVTQVPIVIGIVKALVDATIARTRADATNERVTDNSARLHQLENGGGDQKVDSRLVQHGLLTPDAPTIAVISPDALPDTRSMPPGGPTLSAQPDQGQKGDTIHEFRLRRSDRP